jgi:hypothetical protein
MTINGQSEGVTGVSQIMTAPAYIDRNQDLLYVSTLIVATNT